MAGPATTTAGHLTLDEALPLATGIDPLHFALNAAPRSNKSLTIRRFIEQRTNRAILERRLACTVQASECYVVPHDFCQFVLKAGLADTSVINFFREIEHRPERIRDADPLCGSTPVNPQE